MANVAQEGSPGGWGASRGGQGGGSSVPPITIVPTGGTYTDESGNPITREQAIKRGLISAPGSTGEILRGIGASSPGSTAAAERRLAIEDIIKKQRQAGLLTEQEVQRAKALLESETAQFAGKTQEQQDAMRQRLFEQVVFRAPTVKPATAYQPYPQQVIREQIDTSALFKPARSIEQYTPKPAQQQYFYIDEGKVRTKYAYEGGYLRDIFGLTKKPIEPGKAYRKDIFGFTSKGVDIEKAYPSQVVSPATSDVMQTLYQVGFFLTPPGVFTSTAGIAGAKVVFPKLSLKEARVQLKDITMRNQGLRDFLQSEKASAQVLVQVPKSKLSAGYKPPSYRPSLATSQTYTGKGAFGKAMQLKTELPPGLKEGEFDWYAWKYHGEVKLVPKLQTGSQITSQITKQIARQKSDIEMLYKQQVAYKQRIGLKIETEKMQVQSAKQLYNQVQKTSQQQQSLLQQLQKQVPRAIAIQRAKEVQVTKQVYKEVPIRRFLNIVVQREKQVTKTPQIDKIKEIYTQIQKPISIPKPKIKEPTPQIKRKPLEIPKPPREGPRKTPEEKKIIIAPKDFKEKLNNYSKGRKRRGKYVWNIKNPVPTLKSLTG